MKAIFHTAFVCLLLCCLFVGCRGGSSFPDPVPVTGTITLNGAPLEGAIVSFFTEGVSRLAGGLTDAEGKYSVDAYPGNATVLVTKITGGGEAAELEIDPENPEAGISNTETDVVAEATNEVPAKYSNRENSPLKAEIKAEGTNDFPFDLTP